MNFDIDSENADGERNVTFIMSSHCLRPCSAIDRKQDLVYVNIAVWICIVYSPDAFLHQIHSGTARLRILVTQVNEVMQSKVEGSIEKIQDMIFFDYKLAFSRSWVGLLGLVLCMYNVMNWVNIFMFDSLWPGDAIWWHRTRSTLAQVMARCLTAPSHYLNQCWLIIRWGPMASIWVHYH